MKSTVIPLLGTTTNNPQVVKQIVDAATAEDPDLLQDPSLWRADAMASALLHPKPEKPAVKPTVSSPTSVRDDTAGERRPVRHSHIVLPRSGG